MSRLSVRRSSAWSVEEVERFLDLSVLPIRLGCLGADGTPLVVSLWYLFEDGRFWCALHESAAVLRHLRRDGRCGFEVAGDGAPYQGVRGQAVASIERTRGADVLDALLARYGVRDDSKLARWLRSRRSEEYAVALDPVWVTAWDYRERMRDARTSS